jgi:hypothetical protein
MGSSQWAEPRPLGVGGEVEDTARTRERGGGKRKRCWATKTVPGQCRQGQTGHKRPQAQGLAAGLRTGPEAQNSRDMISTREGAMQCGDVGERRVAGTPPYGLSLCVCVRVGVFCACQDKRRPSRSLPGVVVVVESRVVVVT